MSSGKAGADLRCGVLEAGDDARRSATARSSHGGASPVALRRATAWIRLVPIRATCSRARLSATTSSPLESQRGRQLVALPGGGKRRLGDEAARGVPGAGGGGGHGGVLVIE